MVASYNEENWTRNWIKFFDIEPIFIELEMAEDTPKSTVNVFWCAFQWIESIVDDVKQWVWFHRSFRRDSPPLDPFVDSQRLELERSGIDVLSRLAGTRCHRLGRRLNLRRVINEKPARERVDVSFPLQLHKPSAFNDRSRTHGTKRVLSWHTHTNTRQFTLIWLRLTFCSSCSSPPFFHLDGAIRLATTHTVHC